MRNYFCQTMLRELSQQCCEKKMMSFFFPALEERTKFSVLAEYVQAVKPIQVHMYKQFFFFFLLKIQYTY